MLRRIVDCTGIGRAALTGPIWAELAVIYRQKWELTAMRFSRSDILLKEGKLLTADMLDAAFGRAPWRS